MNTTHARSAGWLCVPRFDSASVFGSLLDRRGRVARRSERTVVELAMGHSVIARREKDVDPLSSDGRTSEGGRFRRTARLEAFSDGVFAIAITLLVLDLAIAPSGSPWERVVDGWPFYLAYVVSFLTIGAAWLAHTTITDQLTNADVVLLQLNLLLLLAVSVLPFPTRLVAESLDDVEGERLFVAMYVCVLLWIRLLLHAVDAYARREHVYPEGELDEPERRGPTALKSPNWSCHDHFGDSGECALLSARGDSPTAQWEGAHPLNRASDNLLSSPTLPCPGSIVSALPALWRPG